MTSWADIQRLGLENPDPAIVVTVAAIRGSTPRESGTKMYVTKTDIRGTIGGGQLEYLAIYQARDLLRTASQSAKLLKLPLGPELAQCCGGYAELLLTPISNGDRQNPSDFVLSTWNAGSFSREFLSHADLIASNDNPLKQASCLLAQGYKAVIFDDTPSEDSFSLLEPFEDCRFHLTLFGAGHVGRAVVNTLSPLPCKIRWVDERASEFPDVIPANVSKQILSDPLDAVNTAPDNSFFLVMTHNHQLDLELVAEILVRKNSTYLGLIGSKTKRSRFEKRLIHRGFTSDDMAQITCPIGMGVLSGKHPAEIAISVASEILYQHQIRSKIVDTIPKISGTQ
jgi:xanthine dehydrogenase accessory factor